MRKLIMLAAMLAMVLLVAAPAFAQDQEAESGDVFQTTDVVGGGDNSNQCVGIQNTANTGNAQNQTILEFPDSNVDGEDNDLDGLIDELDEEFFEDLSVEEFEDLLGAIEDFNEDSDEANVSEFDLEFGDATIDVSPNNVTDCVQSVDQDATAVGGYYYY